jgi:toxin CptA
MSEDKANALQRLLSADTGHVYSEDELDAIEEVDSEMALRLARVQHLSQLAQAEEQSNATVDIRQVEDAITQARAILSQDGGDIELIGVENRIVKVRLKGACVGCPNAALDLKNVVERLVKTRSPGVLEVQNIF